MLRPAPLMAEYGKSPVYHGTSGHLAVYMDEWLMSLYTL